MDKKIALLDLGGVVFQSTGTSNEKIHWEIISRLNWKYGHDLNVGKDVFHEFLREYNVVTSQRLTGQAFLSAVFDTLEINVELIAHLRQKHEIIIVSDNYRENIEYIAERYEFSSWAIDQFYSFDFQMVKGNPQFFGRLLEELPRYEKSDMIFIDDSPEKIASAESHGIRSILFVDNATTFRKLRSIWSGSLDNE